MAYTILSFDGLQVPIYLQRGDEQNMGTGSAQTEFRQLPGGGFYRMRRGKKSPQGIRPVTKSGVLWGENAVDLRQQLDAWRSKIGVYGKLTVRFFDGSLRWQWAELQDVDAPVAASNKGNYVPITLLWQTAAQHWNGIIHGPAWVWGDNSWVFGDGTTNFGQNDLSWTVTSTTNYAFTVQNAGNIDAVNMLIEYAPAGERTNWAVRNDATGQQLDYTAALFPDHIIRVDTAAQTAHRLEAAREIANMSRNRNALTVNTMFSHGLNSGDSVEISGGTRYDGLYRDVSVTDSDTFVVALLPSHYAFGTVTGGNMRRVTDIYPALSITDEQAWMVLSPGANLLRVLSGTTMTGDTVRVRFHDHYA